MTLLQRNREKNEVQETNWDARREKACVNTHAHASASQICAKHLRTAAKFTAGPTLGSKDPKMDSSKDLKEEMKCDPILDPI